MKIRVAELTMNENKIAETRKKATAVALQTKFKPGEILRCFISPDQDLTKKMIRVEVNPLWSGQIAIEASSEDLKIEAPDHNGEVFEHLPKPGEMRLAEVLSARKLKKSQGRGILSLAFDMQASVMRFEVGQRLTGRVIRVNIHPISVLFQLPNGQQATLCATAIANNYEKVTQHITHFKRNGIFHLYALRQDQNPQRNYVCAEGRYESYLKQKEANEYSESRRLFVDRGEVTVGLTCDGFLAKHTAEAVLVEIGPGIIGRLRKSHHPEVTSIALNSILSVRVLSRSKDRKRKIDDEQCAVVKKEKKEKSPTEDIERVVLSDPGFDWSNAGFLPEDLAAVGKIGDELVNESFSAQPSNSSESDAPTKTEVKEGRVKDEKPMSKEELEMEKERLMVNREIKLSGDLVPETQEDFSRLLRKDPNSAEIWIRYISFFLEKNDLSMARATAERALTVINYREETEIFNIWTAYLNMEVMYGDENSTKEIFQRSCGNADALKMHIQMAAIFSEAGKVNEADEVYEVMLKKFRANSDDVWTLYGEHLMKTDRADKARDLMKRALTSVPKQRHVPIISRFAQMEFRNGDIERGPHIV
ncbi:hypothetical protein KIN20_038284 [Parelaphostrongylus tenuis]|uniref:Pre-mRNA-splicing factor Syf1/CRNKL1-like C-terminal HAT-repeats domain-containing protein n=1 Tax=Parelaphostrongylus tenuis TaxID=148309 RepID=A0AAD5RF84_PARTN|nr:hypothetical protein KIN20_038284 [Parelaphostrongylus tenuis]